MMISVVWLSLDLTVGRKICHLLRNDSSIFFTYLTSDFYLLSRNKVAETYYFELSLLISYNVEALTW